ncbi:MAG: hypothetical protein H6657_25400 [Ardenticatenaceae bacterium]|nr:hypothetical protein [Ardenticatenaceae bacterium]
MKRLVNAWSGKRAAREQWEAGLIWFRLRYLTPDGPTRCIRLLSRPQACGRVALYFRPDEVVSALYLGVPEMHVRLLQRMAADFHFSLKPKLPEVAVPAAQRLTAVSELPWERPFLVPFMAHVVNEVLFVSLTVGGPLKKNGRYLPQSSVKTAKEAVSTWQLPADPIPGLTARPNWQAHQPLAHLTVTEPDSGRWLLGRSRTGTPLHVAGRVNIYGRQDAVADWLVHQVTQMVALDHANLMVLDGAGDLVPRLKRKASVTRLLGEQLAYLDIDGTSLANGFNPLAAVPGETGAALLQRWQHWFGGMNVHPQGVQLLVQAQAAGVGDIPSLRKWLKQVERQGQTTAVSSLGLALNRLTANRSLREWLEWPVNRFDILPAGALFFACKGTSWERQQLLRAALLAALQRPDVRLIVHGLSGKVLSTLSLGNMPQIVVSNGPLLPDATIILTESHAQGLVALKKRFLADDVQLEENLALLRLGEAIVLVAGTPFFVSWNGHQSA